MQAWASVASALFAVVFIAAGLAKFVDRRATTASLATFGVPASLARRAWWLLPSSELAVAGLVGIDGTRRVGAVAGLLLLAVFSLAIAQQVRRGTTADCNCFGRLTSTPIRLSLLWRNLTLVVLGLVVAVLADRVRWTGWVGELTDRERILFSIALAALTLSSLFGATVTKLVRDQRELVASVRLVEALFDQRDGRREVASVPAPPPGLPVGVFAPTFELATSDGETRTLGSLLLGGPLLLVFVGGGCRGCAELMPRLQEWSRADGSPSIVAVVGGRAEADGALLAPRPGVTILVDADARVATRYLAQWTPGAVLVGGNGRLASRIAYGAEAIGGLVSFARGDRLALSSRHVGPHPPPGAAGPRSVGAVAPAYDRLRGEGPAADLLVIFWQVTCGFCQRFAPEVLALEHVPPPGLARLVIVSREPPTQPFSSSIVLDPDSTVFRAYGRPGTPSAVLVGADGRLESDVVGGAPLIRQLVGIDGEFAIRHVALPDPQLKPAR